MAFVIGYTTGQPDNCFFSLYPLGFHFKAVSSVNTAAKETNSNTLVHMLQDAEFKTLPLSCVLSQVQIL